MKTAKKIRPIITRYIGILGLMCALVAPLYSAADDLTSKINVPDIINKVSAVLKEITFAQPGIDEYIEQVKKEVAALTRKILNELPSSMLGINFATLKQAPLTQPELDYFKHACVAARDVCAKIIPFLQKPDATINVLESFYNVLANHVPENVRAILGDPVNGNGLMVLVRENRVDFKNICIVLDPYLKSLDSMIAKVLGAFDKDRTMTLPQAGELIATTFNISELNKLSDPIYDAIVAFATKREVLTHLQNLKSELDKVNPAAVRSTVEKAIKDAREEIAHSKES